MATGEFTQKQIAEQLDVTEATICNWKKINEFNVAYTDSLKENIATVAAKAFKTMVVLLNARSEQVRYMAAKDILDRAGFKPTEKVDLSVEPVVITNDLKE